MSEVEAQLAELNKELNPAQRSGAETTEGPLMIIASAGSGKTKVIIHRVASLLIKGVHAANIMAVTFTNEASKTIKNRLEEMIGENGQYVTAGTFHKIIMANVLQAYPDSEFLAKMKINVQELAILDDKESGSLLKESIGELSPDEIQYLEEKEIETRYFEKTMSEERAKGNDVYDFFSSIIPGCSDEQPMRIVANVWRKYNEKCRAVQGIDFDDILLVADKMLKKEKGIAEDLSKRFKYIMLDEYQDTNPVQMSIMDSIAAYHKNICVVGDEKQSIYRFRGADINVILTFKKRYPDAKQVILNQNYRSLAPVIMISNAIANSMSQKLSDGQMIAERKIDEDPEVIKKRRQNSYSIIEFNDEASEARAITKAIMRDIGAGVKPSEIAVLYRNRALKNAIERQLVDHNVKYRLVGDTSFYQKAEVKDVVAMIRFVFNPWDSVAALRILRASTIPISADAARRAMQDEGINAHEFLKKQSERRLTVKKKGEAEAPYSEAAKKVRPFLNLCKMMRESASYHDSGQYIRDILAEIWDIYLRPNIEKKDKNDAEKTSNIRTENVKHILKKVQESLESGRSMTEIIEDLSFMIENQGENSKDEENEIKLMTLHASKGLEFDNTYIIGHDSITTHGENQDENEIEESRRLFYVGCTRAKKKLAVSYSKERMQFGQTIHPEKSPFIEEIESELGVITINFDEQMKIAQARSQEASPSMS